MSRASKSLGVLILAAGKGTRMHSDKPKVLQPLLEEPIVYYPLKAVRDAGLDHIAVLVGHQGDMVASYLQAEWPDVEVIWQDEQLGTGHAVQVAADWWKQFRNVLVLSGDVPLIQPDTLKDLIAKHDKVGPQCTFMSSIVDDPSGYGRVVRLADGGFRIVEQRDAAEEELDIHEINAGVYLFCSEALSVVIDQLSQGNDQGEYYLTDTIQLIGETEGNVNVVMHEDESELLGINSPLELAATAFELNRRILCRHMANGLKCMDPHSTWIGPRVELEPDVFVEPGVQIWGRCRLADGSRVGAYSTLRNVSLGARTRVLGPSVLHDAEIGADAEIGPFAFLRNQVEAKDGVRIGRFVEVKNSVIGECSKVPHLTYIGDAAIGENTNIGAGTITCNYDGRGKHRTEIGSGCFVGSDTMFVAPVSMGDNASTAAGSVVTKDVPEGALAIARSRQTNIDNWYDRKDIQNPKSQGDEEK